MTFTQVDNPDSETCYALADPQKMVFDYTRMMMSALFMKPDPDRILVIGLGGGTLTTALAALLPNAQMDSVEIDPAVLRVAETHFGFKPDDQKRVHIEDGRAFVEAAKARGDQYDLVLLDAFDSTYIPTHLMTEGFLQSVRSVLADDGVVAANTAAASPLFDEESAAYELVFGAFYQLQADNRVILAMKRALPNTEVMTKNAAHWRDALLPYGITPEPFFDGLTVYGPSSLGR